jgi:hypothetical protein
VDLHHIVPRSERGRHEQDNLIVLCGAHHRAVHRGRLTISGRVSTGLRFQRADGNPYCDVPTPNAVGREPTLAKVFRALCGLGFKSREARQALDAVMSREGAAALSPMPTAQELLRAALGMLGPRAARGR